MWTVLMMLVCRAQARISRTPISGKPPFAITDLRILYVVLVNNAISLSRSYITKWVNDTPEVEPKLKGNWTGFFCTCMHFVSVSRCLRFYLCILTPGDEWLSEPLAFHIHFLGYMYIFMCDKQSKSRTPFFWLSKQFFFVQDHASCSPLV